MRFSQSEVVLHLNLRNTGEKDKESSWEWLVNTDPGEAKTMAVSTYRKITSTSVMKKYNYGETVIMSIELTMLQSVNQISWNNTYDLKNE